MRNFVSFGSFGLLAAAVLTACSSDGAAASSSADQAIVTTSCRDVPEWAPDVAYAIGDLARSQGKTYRCIQAHTSLSVWRPEIVPALWEEAGCDGAPPALPPPTDPPPPPVDPPPVAPGGGGTEYAPYFYTWGWGNPAYAFTSLVDLRAKSGLASVTLAFVLSSGGCEATRDIHDHKADVDAFRGAGGRVKASFGGANGTYLENACPSADALARTLEAFVDATGITDLDFDVEQGGAMTPAVNQLRATALASLQRTKGVKVSFTLAAVPRDKWGTPGGMSAASLEVVRSALAAGVRIHRVNLMTMDYGAYFSSGWTMGELAESALTDANAQLRAAIPGLTEEQAWAMLGATPMIGVNDVQSEVFRLEDARRLASFARQKRLGLVSYWAINRDRTCGMGLALCSGVEQAPFAFHEVLKTVQ